MWWAYASHLDKMNRVNVAYTVISHHRHRKYTGGSMRLSVCLSRRSEITMKIALLRSDFLLNNLDWLRSCKNLRLEEIRPVEVLLLQERRKKLCSFSHHVTRPKKGLQIKSAFKTYTSRQRCTTGAETQKKVCAWEVTGIAYRRVEHQPFRHCRSRFFTSGDDLQCTFYFWES